MAVCPICLEPVQHAAVLSCALDCCSARFHADCARAALASERRCPTCRRPVDAEAVDAMDFLLQIELRRSALLPSILESLHHLAERLAMLQQGMEQLHTQHCQLHSHQFRSRSPRR
jgi:hypothetical protein